MASENSVEVDYVVVGAGAVGMAIADTLVSESECTVAIVDRRHKPGGHWRDAYPFVRLHGPSANYGVNSRDLGGDLIEPDGLNEGLMELATGDEICHYFDTVMRRTLLPSSRVTYLPLHEYEDGEAVSLLNGARTTIKAGRKTFDATVADTQVPSRCPPSFEVAEGARLIPVNDVVDLGARPERIVVIGGGKTAIDAVTWLLDNGTDPASVTWVRPRDSWLLNRATIQPDPRFFAETFGSLADQWEAFAEESTVDDAFLRLERKGMMRRIDRSVMPRMFRCAIVSDRELELCRQVTDVVCMGHVRRIEPGKIGLEAGEITVPDGTVFVNCSACGIPRKALQPIFQGDLVVPQYVRQCSPTFSGAVVAKVELLLDTDEEKNALCRPVPIPDKPEDLAQILLDMQRNALAWQSNPELFAWLMGSRLDRFTGMIVRAAMGSDREALALIDRFRAATEAGMPRLSRIVETA